MCYRYIRLSHEMKSWIMMSLWPWFKSVQKYRITSVCVDMPKHVPFTKCITYGVSRYEEPDSLKYKQLLLWCLKYCLHVFTNNVSYYLCMFLSRQVFATEKMMELHIANCHSFILILKDGKLLCPLCSVTNNRFRSIEAIKVLIYQVVPPPSWSEEGGGGLLNLKRYEMDCWNDNDKL